MVMVLLKGLGEERLPEWEVADPSLLRHLSQLATPPPEPLLPAPESPAKSPAKVESLDALLASWPTTSDDPLTSRVVAGPKRTVLVSHQPVIEKVPQSDSANRPVLDSDDDDDDDDDLPVYDMSHDVKLPPKDVARLRYLRDVMDHLGEAGDAADPEECFRRLPALCAKQLAHEDPALVGELLGVMLYAENRCDTTRWFSLRQEDLY